MTPEVRFTFPAEVTSEGALKVSELDRWHAALKKLAGRRVTLTLAREVKTRSLNQNRYYWSIVVAAASEWSGYEPEEVHELFKAMFLRRPMLLPTGEQKEAPRSTTRLTTVEMEQYLDRIRRWAAQNGVYIPLPNEGAGMTA